MQRCMGYIEGAFVELENVVRDVFLPALFGKGVVISDEFRNILSLPARLGGLSIDDTTKDVVTKHLDSMELTRCLQMLLGREVVSLIRRR